jgi:hypothetical protein
MLMLPYNFSKKISLYMYLQHNWHLMLNYHVEKHDSVAG